MPDIIPNTPFTDGSAANADTFAEELYEPLNPPGSLEVINGRLDEVNLVAGDSIDRRDVRPGTFTSSVSVGATAGVDYFYNFFNFAKDETDPMGAPGAAAVITNSGVIPRHVAIPGAGQSFYLYYSSVLFLSWDVEIECDGVGPLTDTEAKDDSVSIRLFIDDQVADGVFDLQNLRKQFATGTSVSANNGTARRHFAGHCVLIPAEFPSFTSEGWHRAEMRIAHQQYQIRVTTRRFNVVTLKA